VNNNENY